MQVLEELINCVSISRVYLNMLINETRDNNADFKEVDKIR